MTKAELRDQYLARRQSLTPAQVREGSLALAERFFATFDLAALGVQYVHIFLPLVARHEVNTWLVIDRLRAAFPAVGLVLPRVDGPALAHHRWEVGAPLVTSHWGIAEPPPGAPFPTQLLDLVLVPLLAFDQSGHRVGYGRGYYDRFLATCRPDALTVGLSLFDPVAAIADLHVTDVPLRAVLTPARAWLF